LKKEIMKKEVFSDENQRNLMFAQIQKIHAQIEALSDEKLQLSEKLFSVQENFIRKLD
jgi:hypothetical protein